MAVAQDTTHVVVVAHDALEVVPGRKAPEDPIPTFELTVRADEIAYVQFSGPRTGEYLAADEVRLTLSDPGSTPDNPNAPPVTSESID